MDCTHTHTVVEKTAVAGVERGWGHRLGGIAGWRCAGREEEAVRRQVEGGPCQAGGG